MTIPPHLIGQHDAVTAWEHCDTCPHGWHGAPCRYQLCGCGGPWAGVADAWLPIKDAEEHEGDAA